MNTLHSVLRRRLSSSFPGLLAVIAVLSASAMVGCGTGAPKAPSSISEGDAAAILKTARQVMSEQKGFEVVECEGYYACDPNHEDFSLTFGPENTMLLRVEGYEHAPYAMASGNDCYTSNDGEHWTISAGVCAEGLYADPRTLLVAVDSNQRVEGKEELNGREHVVVSAGVDLKNWLSGQLKKGAYVYGAISWGPRPRPPEAVPTLPAFDREKIEQSFRGWQVWDRFPERPGSHYLLAWKESWIEVSGDEVYVNIYGEDEVTPELKVELGQILEAFGIPVERMEQADLKVHPGVVWGENNTVPAQVSFWVDSESGLVDKMSVEIGQYDPETGQTKPIPAVPPPATTFTYRYGIEGPKAPTPENVVNEKVQEMITNSNDEVAVIAEALNRYVESHGKCPEEATAESLAGELSGQQWPVNAYAKRPMEASDEFSSGDFRYDGGGESTCHLTGWGWDLREEFDIPSEVFPGLE